MRLFVWPNLAQEVPGSGGVTGAMIRPAVELTRSADPAGAAGGTRGAVHDAFGLWGTINVLDVAEDGLGVEDGLRSSDTFDAIEGLIAAARAGGAARVVIPSGWVEPAGDEDDAPQSRPGAEDFRTHTGEGYRRLDLALPRLLWMFDNSSMRVCLRPESGHVLSDIPSCLMFLRSSWAARVDLLIDPAAMLTVSMAGRAEEHVTRIVESLAGYPGVTGLVVANIELVRDDGVERVRAVGLNRQDRTLIDARALMGVVSAQARAGLDWILVEEDVAGQGEVLRMYGPGV